MQPYNFWQDFFSSYRVSSEAIKALWLIVPPAFAVALAWVVLNAPGMRRSAQNKTGEASQPAGQFPGPSGDA